MSDSPDSLRRKRLRMLACQRGYLEVALILRRLVQPGLEHWPPEDLDSLETLLEMDDLDIWEVVTGRREPPPDLDRRLVQKLRAHLPGGGLSP